MGHSVAINSFLYVKYMICGLVYLSKKRHEVGYCYILPVLVLKVIGVQVGSYKIMMGN